MWLKKDHVAYICTAVTFAVGTNFWLQQGPTDANELAQRSLPNNANDNYCAVPEAEVETEDEPVYFTNCAGFF